MQSRIIRGGEGERNAGEYATIVRLLRLSPYTGTAKRLESDEFDAQQNLTGALSVQS